MLSKSLAAQALKNNSFQTKNSTKTTFNGLEAILVKGVVRLNVSKVTTTQIIRKKSVFRPLVTQQSVRQPSCKREEHILFVMTKIHRIQKECDKYILYNLNLLKVKKSKCIYNLDQRFSWCALGCICCNLKIKILEQRNEFFFSL